jgi:predicted PurR-regulated permease PerM
MADPSRGSPLFDSSRPTAILVVAVLLLVALGYVIAPVLSPFVLLAAIIFVLYPLRHEPFSRRLIWLAALLFVAWFVYALLGVLLPFAVAFLIAYLLNPLVTWLTRRGLPRWASSLVAVLLFLAFCPGLLILIMPAVIEQFQGIVAGAREIAAQISVLLESGAIFGLLSGFGIPPERLREMIKNEFTPGVEGLLTLLFQGILEFVTGVSSLAMHLINVVLIPFVVFYVLMDFPTIITRISAFVPASERERFERAVEIADGVIGQYFRGAIIVAFIQGTISGVVLWLIGVKYALILGIMTGLLNFIPYVGLITSLVVASVVAMFSGGPPLSMVTGVVVLYLGQKILEATVLGPKIVGSKVGLHPVVLILCLLVFGHFLGFVGMLVAVPATALIIAGVREWESGRGVAVTGLGKSEN